MSSIQPSTRSLLKGLVTILLSTLFLASCDHQTAKTEDHAPKITLTHEMGETQINENPQSVVVFNTATLDTMDALNIKIAGVPQSGVHYPTYLQKYATKEYLNVGTLFEPNYEVLSEIDPDLIVSGGRTLDAYLKLSEIAPTIALGNNNQLNYQENLINTLTDLGFIFHKEALAKELIQKFNQSVIDIEQQTALLDQNNENTAMILMINGGKFASYSAGSRFGFIFDSLGFKFPEGLPNNINGQHGNVVSPELVAQINPSWLFVLNRDQATGANPASSVLIIEDNPMLSRTEAFKKNQIIYFNSDEIYIAGGYQAYLNLMQQIQQALAHNQAVNRVEIQSESNHN